ncbi:hypothetical protein ACFQY7_34380 [Actinomadura luteofluorescens]|uniref:Uncharacterized protein n=1 Tax=Actinomadura luteofluorescens TaxID=46163 RepID=A0A7Y9JI04_9ACTN|nr:hypothetical protein [Actinomadura luteofluorescens]NYD49148.1 hypothetical protein [Actinomadura luteofluorescens]
MSYPQPALTIPRVTGDNAAELDAEIERYARAFFGTDAELAFPDRYHAELTNEKFSDSKLYAVEGVTVRRDWPNRRNIVERRVDLPPVRGGGVAEIEAEIKRLTTEFFGSETRITPQNGEYKVVLVPDAEDDKKYEVKGVSVKQSGKWPTAA